LTASAPSVAPSRLAGGDLAADLRAIEVVWKRELLRFFRNRLRLVTSFVQPILFLFVIGTGFGSLVPSAGGVDFRTFMFPGVLAMTVLFAALFSAISIVWDREFGFLREMLVAPVRRGAIVVGKCAGGATTAVIQGAIMLAFAGLVGVPYTPGLLAILFAEMLLVAITMTAIGVLMASRMSEIQSFQAVMQFFMMPMFFLSGAIFPPSGLPTWLSVLTRIDPLSYAVDPMRRAVFSYVTAPPSLEHRLNAGLTWGGYELPIALELVIVAAFALVSLAVAIWQFSKAE
jgi:ABC-2 type transport system permease protein